jgi:hypothetical protein
MVAKGSNWRQLTCAKATALCEICSSTCAFLLHENFHTFDNAIVVENTSSQALILASI